MRRCWPVDGSRTNSELPSRPARRSGRRPQSGRDRAGAVARYGSGASVAAPAPFPAAHHDPPGLSALPGRGGEGNVYREKYGGHSGPQKGGAVGEAPAEKEHHGGLGEKVKQLFHKGEKKE